MSVKAEIIAIGDEILYGQTLDTNSHWISQKLDELNIKVYQKTTIGDTEDHILSSLKQAEARADIVLITGGLGPTSDDLTKPCLAKYFNVGLTLNEEALQEIKDLFNRAGRDMTIHNELQAELPDNCEKISNKMGTAPGMWFEERGTIFMSMPGVPYEMKTMMERDVLPRLAARFQKEVIVHRIVKTVGIPESRLADLIKDWQAALPPHQKLAYLPTHGQVKLRITGTGGDEPQIRKDIQKSIDDLVPLITKYVYGYDHDELETVLGKMLLDRQATISTAESCTGGNIAAAITKVPGSSAYFMGSVVAYDNEIKKKALGVSEATLSAHGAVSEEVVKEMAEGVRLKMGTDVGISTSGIAGPGGGSEEKPVGTVWIGYADKDKTVARKMNFTKDREMNIRFATTFGLNMFRLNF